jgi:hypothetical protein
VSIKQQQKEITNHGDKDKDPTVHLEYNNNNNKKLQRSNFTKTKTKTLHSSIIQENNKKTRNTTSICI